MRVSLTLSQRIQRLVTISFLIIAVCSPKLVMAIRPLPPNAPMINCAPQNCLLFFHSAGFSTPDPTSDNKTEQMFADPEIQTLVAEVKKMMNVAIERAKRESGDQQEQEEMELVFGLMKKLATRPMTFYFSDVDVEQKKFNLAFVLDVGPHADEVKRAIERAAADELKTAEKLTINGIPCQRVSGGDHSSKVGGKTKVNDVAYWTVHNETLMFTIGEDSFDLLTNGMNSGPPRWLMEVSQRLEIEHRGFLGYFNIRQFANIAEAESAKGGDEKFRKGWQALGLNGLNHAAFTWGLEGDGLRSRSLLTCESMEGILKLFDNDGLGADDIARLPAKASSATALRMDPAEVFDTLVEIARALNPQADEQLGEFREQFAANFGGIDLRDDLLSAIGDKWIVYQPGGFATMMVPDMVAAVNLRDRDKAEQILAGMVDVVSEAIAKQGNGTVSIKTKTFNDVKGYSVRGLPVALSFCIDDDELIVGLSAAAIKNHLKYTPAIENSKATDERLEPLLGRFEQPLAVTYADTGAWIEMMYPSLQMMLNMASGPLANEGIELDPSVIPPAATFTKYLEPSVMAMSRVPDGIEWESREVLPRMNAAAAGVGIVLMLPAVNAAREAARRNGAVNNARQIGLALLNYESAFGRFPTTNKNGLSWRVHILPFMEEQTLYDKFHLEEPWDSPHNKKLLKEIPAVYVSPNGTGPEENTHYLAVAGPDPVLAADGKGIGIAKITDGVANTAMVVEVDDALAVPWTKPSDFEWTADDPSKGLGGMHSGGIFVVCFVDCHTVVIPKTVAKDALAAIFTKSGGEAVDHEALAP